MSSAGENSDLSGVDPNNVPSTSQAQQSTDQIVQPIVWTPGDDYRNSDYCLEIPLTFLNETAVTPTSSTTINSSNSQTVVPNQSRVQHVLLLPLSCQLPVTETPIGINIENPTENNSTRMENPSSVEQILFDAQPTTNVQLISPSIPNYTSYALSTGETQSRTHQNSLPSFQSAFMPELQSMPTFATENANNHGSLNSSADDDSKNRGFNDQTQFSCPICGKVFGRHSHLKRHAAAHSDEKNFVCEYCDKKFGRKDHFHKHLKTHFNADGTPRKPRKFGKTKCQCAYCTAEGGNQTLGPNGNPLHLCPVADCGSVFEQVKSLMRHLRGHSDEKNFLCDYCNKGFARRDKFKEHVRRHMRSLQLKEDKDDGRVEESKHEDEKQKHACQFAGCGIVFNDVKNLVAHIVSQHAVGPYSCDFCDEKFRYKKDLQRHEELAHPGEAKFVCPYCKKQCRGDDTLKRHIYLIHENPTYSRNEKKK